MSVSITIYWDDVDWPKKLRTEVLSVVMDAVSDTCEILGYDMPDSGVVKVTSE